MKKVLLSMILFLSLILSCGIQTLAAETSLNESNGQVDVDVYASTVENTVWETITPAPDGTGRVTLPDGTEIKVAGITDPRMRLVIYAIPKSDTEATTWLASVLDGMVDGILPYHICFEDAEGKQYPAFDVTITIEMSYPATNPVVYSVESDGTSANLNGTAADNALTFVSDGSPFYVLGEKHIGPLDTDPDAPQTGDSGIQVLGLLLVTATACAFVLYRKRSLHRVK